MLRPGNAGSNTAADHVEIIRRALDQAGLGPRPGRRVLVRIEGPSLSSCLCMWCGLQVGVDSVGIGQGQLLEGLLPVGGYSALDQSAGGRALAGSSFLLLLLPLSGSLVLDVADSQPQQLDRCLVGGEVTPVPGDLAQLVARSLDTLVEGAPPTKWGRDDPSHHRWEGQEGSESLPGVGEGPDRGRVALSELTGLEGLQGLPCGLLAGGLVDRPESRYHGLAVAVGHEPRGGPDQVDYACLDRRLGPGRLNRLRQPRQPVTAHDQHVLDTAVGQLSAHLGPEPGPLAGLDPDAQDVLDPVHVHAYRDMRGLVGHVSPVADLDHDGVEVDHRVEAVQWPVLPGQYLLADLVGDLADRLMTQISAQRRGQMVLDVPHRHPPRRTG